MLASSNMLAVTRVSVTISTLYVKGRQSARVEIEQEHPKVYFNILQGTEVFSDLMGNVILVNIFFLQTLLVAMKRDIGF